MFGQLCRNNNNRISRRFNWPIIEKSFKYRIITSSRSRFPHSNGGFGVFGISQQRTRVLLSSSLFTLFKRGLATSVTTNTTTPISPIIDKKYTVEETQRLIESMNSNFRVVRAIKTDYGVDITKFRSMKTRLTVVHVDVEAPIVNGYFALATEATDDSGCPHTLEHLVFLGSELYPYKGVLDTLANRAIAQGTNAWTDVDNTCYTISVAGSGGFLNMLPIYVDHILYPTLTNSGYVTEVHHINGKGEDAGVVYSEMQGRQNDGDSRCLLELIRAIYPEGCGYRSETGGLMECIRELDNDKIRQYHKDYYRPDNLCLVITGKIPHENLLNILDPLDNRIASKGQLPQFRRPWIESGPIQTLKESVTKIVEFPDEDESMGQIMVGWQGPRIYDRLDLVALEILHKYLTDSAISVLQKEFVEIEDPLCTYVYFHIKQHLRTEIHAWFYSVPTEELENLSAQILPVLERVVKEGFDMDRMKTVIYREKLKTLNYVEVSPHRGFANACIIDFIYGKENGEGLEEFFKDLYYFDQVAKFTNDQWKGYLKKWYLDCSHVKILGKPSAEFARKLTDDEKQRVERQCEKLGPEKLKGLEERLEEARQQNEIPVPKDIIEGFPVQQTSGISFIDVVTGRNEPGKFSNSVQTYLNQDNKANIPYFIQYDHIKSAFVSITIYISTSSIPSDLRPYIDIYINLFYSLPLNRPDGVKLTYEEVIKMLNEDTVQYSAGRGDDFESLLCISLKVEASKYPRAIQWLRDLLWHTEFVADRLKIVASQLINDIPAIKRDGSSMTYSVLRAFLYDPVESNQYALNTLKQEKFLPEVLEKLEKSPDKVIKDLERFRNILTEPENFRIHVVGDILKLQNPKSAWEENFRIIETSKPLTRVVLANELLTISGKNPGNKGYIVGLPAIESTFSVHVAKGPVTFDSRDFAPLLVLCELLQTMEGIFWRLVRGKGLAYGVNLNSSLETGLIYFTVYRSPDAFKAFDEARQVIKDLSENKIEFERSDLEGARSSVIFSIVSSEKTMARAAGESFVSQCLKNLPPKYNHILIERVQAVTIDDLHVMLNKYLTNLFLAETSNVVVVCAPAKVKDIQEGFEKYGFKLEQKDLDLIV